MTGAIVIFEHYICRSKKTSASIQAITLNVSEDSPFPNIRKTILKLLRCNEIPQRIKWVKVWWQSTWMITNGAEHGNLTLLYVTPQRSCNCIAKTLFKFINGCYSCCNSTRVVNKSILQE